MLVTTEHFLTSPRVSIRRITHQVCQMAYRSARLVGENPVSRSSHKYDTGSEVQGIYAAFFAISVLVPLSCYHSSHFLPYIPSLMDIRYITITAEQHVVMYAFVNESFSWSCPTLVVNVMLSPIRLVCAPL